MSICAIIFFATLAVGDATFPCQRLNLSFIIRLNPPLPDCGVRACQVKALLAAGADPQAQNAVGESALHLASLHGHAECAKGLLAGGAQVSVYTQQGGHSAFHYAAGGGHLPILKQLKKALGPEAKLLASGGGSPKQAKAAAKKSKKGGKAAAKAAGAGGGFAGPPAVLASVNGRSASGELPLLRAVRALGGQTAATNFAAEHFQGLPSDLAGVAGTLQHLGSVYASPLDAPPAKGSGGKKSGGGKASGAKKGGGGKKKK